LGLLAERPDRFAIEVHAFVLMDNHYHLLLRTTEANLSQAVRWLNVSYAVKFNWAHRLRGTVFQGRFKSVVIQGDEAAVKLARYIHLNPVRIGGLGAAAQAVKRFGRAMTEDPERRRFVSKLKGHLSTTPLPLFPTFPTESAE
jgi:REP element-mobilizing transposase RayT